MKMLKLKKNPKKVVLKPGNFTPREIQSTVNQMQISQWDNDPGTIGMMNAIVRANIGKETVTIENPAMLAFLKKYLPTHS